ncbi:MAG TPA: amino acid ABC transporter substrate-binding protein [Burkholderiales bacterium]|nr:amino acid ABC transporter substrate-binding protein [Burkholderiales bacterium]
MTRLLAAIVLFFSVLAAHAEGGVLAAIKASGTIRLGYLKDAPPFSSVGTDGAPQGYSVALCERAAESIRQELGLASLKLEWVPLTLQERIPAVASHKVDLECGTTTWTLSRQREVDFSLMTFVDGATVLVRADSDLFRLADLKSRKVAVVPTTTTATALQAALKLRMLQIQVVTVSSPEEGLAKLQEGVVDGYASDRLVLIGQGTVSLGERNFRLLDEDFSLEPYALALPRGDADFRLAVDRALAGLYRSGEIKAIFDRWLGPLGRPSLLLSALYYLQSIPE